MENMYGNVIPFHGRKRPKGRFTMGILIVVVVVFFVLCLYPPVRMMAHKTQYKEFVTVLSTATYRTSSTQVLTAQVDGQTLAISQDNAYKLCGAIVKQGPCYISNEQPQREPDVRLSYGIYGTMDLWDVPLEDDSNGFSNGVYIHFTSDTEDVDFSYLMVGDPLRDLLTAYLSPELNTVLD
ncbi:hypothetical protein [Pseudoflavonifractor sp. An85]|uniref:hypothetical protein n=1 Tax=Pseudoflavonifractor sp. An85 TaxID=1965661 RepID=UPI000B3A518F|nr:hypothetical protein [Pseudoflavonifractor sp. An85]OUN25374.1 hypothetical protein B5G37_03945 [Pseudoflavonifractor sp. An85]